MLIALMNPITKILVLRWQQHRRWAVGLVEVVNTDAYLTGQGYEVALSEQDSSSATLAIE